MAKAYRRMVTIAGREIELPEGWTVTPGLVDLQVNGLGDLFPLDDPGALPALDRAMAEAGVARYLVAVPSAAPGGIRTLAESAATVAADPGTGLLGLHLEGPVLSPGFRGAHRSEDLRSGDDPEALALLDLPGVRLVTVAPDAPGGMDYARAAMQRGIVVAAGHTGATAEQAHRAIEAGVTLATHLFNAMAPVHQRAPGAAIAYLTDPRARVAFIADGEHLHDDVVELILAAAPGRCLLVSDVAPNGGVREGHEGLAGSAATLADGVRRLVRVHGRSLPESVLLASERPAAVLGESSGSGAGLTIWDGELGVAGCVRGDRVAFASDALSDRL
jgi:N-acetylglucosamine-6-phosphate deacetylase